MFGAKVFSTYLWQDANEHLMAGLETEVRWLKPVGDDGSFHGPSLVFGFENSTGNGHFELSPGDTLDMDALEVDLGVRYTFGQKFNANATGYICLYGGLGWAMLEG